MAHFISGYVQTSHDSDHGYRGVLDKSATGFYEMCSWESFRSEVLDWQSLDKAGNTPHNIIKTDGFDHALEYFEDLLNKVEFAEGGCADVVAKEVAIPQLRFGDVIWENMSTDLYVQDSNSLCKRKRDEFEDGTFQLSSGFRSMGFSRFVPSRNRVDIVCRFATSADPPCLAQPSVGQEQSAVWRNSPFNTVAVVTLRLTHGGDTDYREGVRQVGHYLESTLMVTPDRQVAFGVVSDLRSCVFVAVLPFGDSINRSYDTYHSAIITEGVARELASFATTAPEAMGALLRLPTEHFEPTKFLGRGSTSWAMSGLWRGQELVMKVSLCPAALELERHMLSYLHSYGSEFSECIPQVHPEAQAVLSPQCKESCSVFTERYSINIQFTEERVLELWTLLCKLHRHGVVHRDIRPPNVALRTTDEPRDVEWMERTALLDFGSAKIVDTSADAAQRFQQSCGVELSSLEPHYDNRPVSTSSVAVLRGAETLPADEACALIYCTLQATFPESHLLFKFTRDHATFIRERDTYFWQDRRYGKPAIDDEAVIIQAALRNLQDMREHCTEAQRTAEVQTAVAAVFRWRSVIPKT